MEPLINNGTLKLCADHMLLNEQLQLFPNAKYDDGPDALEMCVRLAEKPRTCKVVVVGGDRENWYSDYQKNCGWMPLT